MTRLVCLLTAMTAIAAVSTGCNTAPSAQEASPPPAAGAAMRTGSADDEGACERAVSNQTGNGDTIVLSSDFSQANTEVIVGVGPKRARWKCLVSRGVVAEVTSLTDEGAL